jgi:hypothetical protein
VATTRPVVHHLGQDGELMRATMLQRLETACWAALIAACIVGACGCFAPDCAVAEQGY